MIKKLIKAGTKKVLDIVTSEVSKEAEKAIAMRAYRKEASRLASLANKRIKRLEEKKLLDAPAYRGLMESGEVRFSVRGKTYNELQKEVARMRNFISANTSTIKGVNTYLKDIATNTGIKYTNLNDLYAKSSKFFELTSKVEQYLRTVEDMASAIGYQQIWEAINEYVKEESINLSDSELQIEELIEIVSQRLKDESGSDPYANNNNWFRMDS